LLLFSLPLFALVSYFVLLICYSAIRLLSRKCVIKLSVSVSIKIVVPTVSKSTDIDLLTFNHQLSK